MELTIAIVSLVGVIISGIVSVVVATLTNNKTMALVELRMSNLEEKQDKHNNLIERMYKLEQRVDDMTR